MIRDVVCLSFLLSFWDIIKPYFTYSERKLDKLFVSLYLHNRPLYYLAQFCTFLICLILIHGSRLMNKKEPDYWTSSIFKKPQAFFLTSVFLAVLAACAIEFLTHHTFLRLLRQAMQEEAAQKSLQSGIH